MSKAFIKSEHVIAETINNETIILNVNNGIYYSLEDTASLIWIELEKGTSSVLLNSLFVETPNGREMIDIFLEELYSENLIVEYTGKMPGQQGTSLQAFKKPIWEKYTDMKEFLELDPVHEVYHHSNKPNK